MVIKTAEFLCSSSKISQCPESDMHEYAFIGRSNVGKSSLINMLTGNSSLAKVSSTPGKTKLINHFTINNRWSLVDLPGYGYARTSKKERAEFSKIITNYITKREHLHCLFVLIDSRLEPQAIDLNFLELLGENGIPFCILFTKIDKLTQAELHKNTKLYKTRLLEQWEELPPIILTSAEKGTGRDQVLEFIEKCLQEP